MGSLSYFKINRWKKASKAEEEFWAKRINHDSNAKEFWKIYFRENFGISPSFFEGKKVLEIGCGPHGAIGFIEKAYVKIGVDPLRFNSGFPHCICVGEALPFRSNAFDIIVCLNVLDHVIEPEEVMREISRTLTSEGFLLLSIHTFPEHVNKIIDLASPYLDKPHPHHLTSSQVELLCNVYGLQILQRNVKSIQASNIKTMMGNLLFVKETFVTAKKGSRFQVRARTF